MSNAEQWVKMVADDLKVAAEWQIQKEATAAVAENQDNRLADQQPEAERTPDSSKNREEKMPFLGFVGSYSHSIDTKGRMIIPAAFREALGERFAVCPTPDYKAIAIYPLSGWQQRQSYLLSLVDRDAEAQDLLNAFSKYSYINCETDAQGRLLLPQGIRTELLGDVRNVDVNGATTHIRVLSSEASKEEDRRFKEKFPDPLAAIAEMQRRG